MQPTRLAVPALLALALLAPAAEPLTFTPVRLGGGGFVTGQAIHPRQADLVYARTDVGGCYRWDPAARRWIQLFTDKSMPAAIVEAGDKDACNRASSAYAVAALGLAPSDPRIVYAAAGGAGKGQGWLFKSEDQGAHWQPTTLAAGHAGNGEGRTCGERIAVKPDDPAVVLVGSCAEGLWRSADGGASWAAVAGVPAGEPVDKHHWGVVAVAFDPGTPARVYASVAGAGIHRSDDAGLSWRRIAEGWAGDLEIADDGTVVACGGKGFGIQRYRPEGEGAWTTLKAPAADIGEIALDRQRPQRLFALRSGGKGFFRTLDGGASWTALGTNTQEQAARANFRTASWKAAPSVAGWRSIGALDLDPHHPERLWLAEGFGMWRCDDAGDAVQAPLFDDCSDGIEEMVANDVVAAGGGRLITAVWDGIGFTQSDPSVVPRAKNLADEFSSTWALAQQPGHPATVAAVVSSHLHWLKPGVWPGLTTDGGTTWTPFAAVKEGQNTPPDLRFGEMVMSADGPEHLIWHPRFGKKAVYWSADRGASWQRAALEVDDWDAMFFGSRRRLAADGATPGTALFYRWKQGDVQRTTDHGATWADSGGRLPVSTFHSQLKAVPGQAGTYLFATGWDFRQPSRGLYWSRDAGATWARDPAVQDAWVAGFGAPRPGGSQP
ncbi:MAG: hypothetical protein L6R48_01985, partial [Planctomycetes bacterium]|nr:hypothetical protein [Planctomycetota bacterium]